MKENKMDRMKELVEQLSQAAYAYEQEDREVMTNREYDALYDELKQLEEETGTILSGSVTQKVGYEITSSLPKVTHSKRMLSLDKTKEVSKLKAFLGNEEGLLSWKLDGLTIVCTYEGGKLVSAVTRGNGTVGEEITNNARTFKNLPLTIDEKERLILRGEAIITYADFAKINEGISEADGKYKNPRNLCSGSVRQLNPQITAKRNVRLYAFTLVEGGPDFETKEEQLNWLNRKGFQTVEYRKVTASNVEEAVEYFSKAIDKQEFASDGLVLTYNNRRYSASLGETAKFPKDSIAFKWKDEIVETKLVNIEWNTSRTGLINPVAIFEPVDIEGTTVERASVHNLSILEELKLGIGDRITVYKANMIIPQIAENLTKSNHIEIPEICPVCGAPTEIKQDKQTKTLVCSNSNCKAQRLRAFAHFTTRDAMNIEGLSEATIEKFLERDYLEDFTSLYHLAQYEAEIIEMEGLGKKSFTKLMNSIEKSRDVAIANFIYALGISQVGLGTAKLICKHFNNDLEAMMEAAEEELTAIDGVGPVIAEEFAKYFSLEANKSMVNHLKNELSFKVETNVVLSDSKIANKTFVVTGDVTHFKNRKELQAKIESLGGKVTGSVSKNTDYLINNDSESSSSKNKKAKELGIPILTEEAFLSLIE
ncbi:MAG: NAD-dependent DNA ligase LigA [Candidatus Cellulosilyticum pullistercoris]|uniref:DNA ligase n=1 Tax=Candidatus Cellulosilyticum pullistercoris TaxID=2838521 RepID=A0A9E2NJM9_9FIRM|nr:NAD-dependent DNA ligase LigA [Candidatus Cellulosilyticum pullistercoris]